MEMHRRFRFTCGAGRECEHAHIVSGGRNVVEGSRLVHSELREIVLTGAAVKHCRQAGDGSPLEVRDEAMVAEGQVHLGYIRDRAQLARAQQGHRRHCDPARLEDAEPGRDEPGVVGASQQHTVPRQQARFLDQHTGDLVGSRKQVGVGPRFRVCDQAAPGAFAGQNVPVDELGRAVDRCRVMEPWKREQELRPTGSRREVVPGESIDMRRLRDLHLMPSR